jgi:hypothetical protein
MRNRPALPYAESFQMLDGLYVASCPNCGALAHPITELPRHVSRGQFETALTMLVADTGARCLEGVDAAPACRKPTGGLASAAPRLELVLA